MPQVPVGKKIKQNIKTHVFVVIAGGRRFRRDGWAVTSSAFMMAHDMFDVAIDGRTLGRDPDSRQLPAVPLQVALAALAHLPQSLDGSSAHIT